MRKVAVSGVLLIALLAGCGGGGDTSKDSQGRDEAYMKRVLEARSRMGQQIVGTGLGSDNGPSEQARGFHKEAVAIARYADELDAIKPPANVAAAHHEFAAAWRSWAHDYERAAGQAIRGHDPFANGGDPTSASTDRHLKHAGRALHAKGYPFE
jgi:cytochrome c556